MREVDRLMIEKYRIGLIQMMENAGRQLAELTRERFLGGDPRGSSVLVLAGTGGNGGGGLVAARYLANWGAEVRVALSRQPDTLAGVPAEQAEILRQIRVPLIGDRDRESLPEQKIILDAVIGYSLKGAPYGRPAELIQWVTERPEPVVSLDLPSGLDPDRGVCWDLYVKAEATLTLALPKKGLLTKAGRKAAGKIYLADIGVPPALYQELDLKVGPIFSRKGRFELSSAQFS